MGTKTRLQSLHSGRALRVDDRKHSFAIPVPTLRPGDGPGPVTSTHRPPRPLPRKQRQSGREGESREAPTPQRAPSVPPPRRRASLLSPSPGQPRALPSGPRRASSTSACARRPRPKTATNAELRCSLLSAAKASAMALWSPRPSARSVAPPRKRREGEGSLPHTSQ